MKPRAIALLALRQKDVRSPETTILAELGLDTFPTVATHPVEDVNRFYAVEAAFRELIAGIPHTETLPTKRRQTKGKRVRFVCEGCGTVEMWEPWRARKQRYCSQACAARNVSRDPEVFARNMEIVRHWGRGFGYRDLAVAFEQEVGNIERVCREYRRGDGWARDLEGRLAQHRAIRAARDTDVRQLPEAA